MKRTFALLIMSLFILAACGHPTPDGLLFATADPALSIGFRWAPLPPGIEVAPAVAPDPVAVELEETEAGQQTCIIAGNIGADNELIYHMPNGIYYSRVKIDLTRSNGAGMFEQYFCTEADAQAAGFRKSSR